MISLRLGLSRRATESGRMKKKPCWAEIIQAGLGKPCSLAQFHWRTVASVLWKKSGVK